MRYITAIIALLALFIFLIYPAYADVIGWTDAEVRAIAEPVLEGIFEGFRDDDYTKYSKDFDATLKKAVTKKIFHENDKQLEESMGECVEKKYLGFFQKSNATIVLWKGTFDRSEEEIVIKLAMSKSGDAYFVTGLWFQ